jgi:hypothetical protein
MTNSTPLALPGTSRNMLQGRIHAINMIGNITFVTKDQIGLVMLEAAAFAHSAVQTPPAFLKDDLSDPHVDAVGVVALPTLGASN